MPRRLALSVSIGVVAVFALALLGMTSGSPRINAQTAGWSDAPPGGTAARATCPSLGQWVLLYWSGPAAPIDRAASACGEVDRIWSNRAGRWLGFDPSAGPANDSWTVEPGEAHFLHSSCLGASAIERLWPPKGTISHQVSEDRFEDVSLAGTSFGQVQILATACANVRGSGPEAYVAFAAPITGGADRKVYGLATYHRRENAFVTVGPTQGGVAPYSLTARDLTGDGRDDVIFQAVGGATFTNLSVWTWQEQTYRQALSSTSYLTPARYLDLDGDGRTEIVTYARLLAFVVGAQWPAAFRWDGSAFRPFLAPAVFDEFIERAKTSLGGEIRGRTDAEIAVHVALARAYRLQGKTNEASESYRAAWQLVPSAEAPPACGDPVDAVAAYYAALNSGDLHVAYRLLSVAQPFWEWAPAFAPVTSVRLLEAQRAPGQSGEGGTVSATISIVWLTPSGDREQRISGVWQVTRLGQACVLGPWQPTALAGTPGS